MEQKNSNRPVRCGGTLLLALAFIGVTSGAVHALDLCIDSSTGGKWALKNFRIPGNNKCAPVQGIENDQPTGGLRTGFIVSGTACTNPDVPRLIVQYTSGGTIGYLEVGVCRVDLPIPPEGKIGVCDGAYVSAPNSGGFEDVVTFRYCSPVHVPL